MNARCLEIVGWFRPKPGWLGALLAVSLFPLCAHGTDEFWINTGFVGLPPQVDAFNFINSGTINIATSLPFKSDISIVSFQINECDPNLQIATDPL